LDTEEGTVSRDSGGDADFVAVIVSDLFSLIADRFFRDKAKRSV
jgi:hypothetical protein